jgi:acetylornithine/succinyldiaminopimelate/putrescine aminotransferase
MTLAKGLGGGVPIGAFMAKEKCSVFVPGDHGTTFGGNPLTCAVAYAVFKYVLDNDVPGMAKKAGAYLMEGLNALKKKYGFITEVRGRGLLAAVQFDRDIGGEVLTHCLEAGVLVNRVKPNAIRIMPPLVISNKEMDTGLARLDKALAGIKT